ncbi:AraC family ligand binding domain-containing protein [Bacillus atrophaeus]|uniref:AraC family ligand binding domain-containing protein n=1 Tax=Bacillus atrophaeus TaxID=1452 RepID=UPI002282B612|nr:AraC family ligand binding domain-containing protein [Bacillus atrophaeus]MCY8491375.1 AraC family ligand binding domain-containing protein [Bacillus atrophaeus]MCY8816906.1 AraC family ligand binding domain-containing protein [Bacillus atrophaeus]
MIRFIEKGKRYLACQDQEYIINPGVLLLFNPRDTHSCEQIDGRTLDYGVSMSCRMSWRKKEITGTGHLPYFSKHVLYQHKLTSNLQELHVLISRGRTGFAEGGAILASAGRADWPFQMSLFTAACLNRPTKSKWFADFRKSIIPKMYKGVPVTSPESELALDWNSYNQYLFPVVGIAALVVVGQLGKLTDNKGEEASAKLAALLFAVFSYISS